MSCAIRVLSQDAGSQSSAKQIIARQARERCELENTVEAMRLRAEVAERDAASLRAELEEMKGHMRSNGASRMRLEESVVRQGVELKMAHDRAEKLQHKAYFSKAC
eukprot:tig00000829_g4650.t1